MFSNHKIYGTKGDLSESQARLRLYNPARNSRRSKNDFAKMFDLPICRPSNGALH